MDCAHFDHEIVLSWEFLLSQWVRALELPTVHRAKYFSATIQLLSETDICWDQLQLVPAACDLKPLPLTCRGLTRSSGSIHLLLISCRHQSLNADTYATLACTYTPSAGPAVQTVHRSLLGLSERNDYHTSVSTSLSPACVCHVPISSSNSDIYWQQHWSLYANADCGQMSARGFECMSFHPLCVFGMLIHHDPSLPLSSIATIVQQKFIGLNCILSSTESGDTYQRQVLSIFSIASGICLLGVACMALYRHNKWVMPARTTLVAYAPGCAERALYYHGMEPNEILSVSQLEDVLARQQI